MPLYPKSCQGSTQNQGGSRSNNMDISYKGKCKVSKNSVLDNGQHTTESVAKVKQSSNSNRGRYAVLSSHRPIVSQNNGSANSPEGKKAIRAFSELRQAATTLYPSTSKTSVFLQQTHNSEDIQMDSFTSSPFIHMIMADSPDTFKVKGHPGFVDSVFGNETKSTQTKELLKKQMLHQHSSYSELNPIQTIRDIPDSVSSTSEAMSNEDGLLFSNGRSSQMFEKLITNSIIAERISELNSKLNSKNAEIIALKRDMQSIRAIAEESSKEANLSKKLLQNFRVKINSMEEQIDILEDKISSQESEILQNLVNKIEENSTRNSSSDESLSSTTVEAKEIDQPVKNGSFSINFDKILTNIGDLNRRMDKMQSMQLIYANDKSSATFKLAKPIVLILYKNGIVLGDTGFRSFSVDSAKQVLIDICKGYFPSELYTQNPNGIFIDVTDRRGVEFKSCDSYNGKGTKLCAVTKAPNLPLKSRFDVQAKKPDIISSVESLDFSGQSRCKLVQLPDLSGKSLKKLDDKIIVLKLKHISNDGGYKMKVSVWTTIEEIVAHLAHFIEKDEKLAETSIVIQPKSKINLISSIPFGVLSMPHASLKEYGIEQNTLLYINKAQD